LLDNMEGNDQQDDSTGRMRVRFIAEEVQVENISPHICFRRPPVGLHRT
jgi:hypothetical protein